MVCFRDADSCFAVGADLYESGYLFVAFNVVLSFVVQQDDCNFLFILFMPV